MRINQPITEEQHAQADKDYAELAQRQKAYFNELANRLEAGETINSMDRKLAAALIRRAAAAISTKRKRPKGQPAQVPDTVRLEYARLLGDGLSSNKAMEELCERYSASLEAIKGKLGMVRSKKGWERRRAETEFWVRFESMAISSPETKPNPPD